VTLAGFGVARLAAKGSAMRTGRTLRRRALLLGIMGVLNLVIWPGDILRVYAVALFAAPVVLAWSTRTRAWLASGLVLLYVAGMLLLDWTKHWNFDTLEYVGVWTSDGFVRNLLFDGFRPVVPWLSFFLVGSVLADRHVQCARVQWRLVWMGAVATGASLIASRTLDAMLMRAAPQLDALTREALVGTSSLPPLPLFMLSAMGTTSMLLGATLLLLPHTPRAVTETLSATGRRALTWYIGHIVVLVTLYAIGYEHRLQPGVAVLAAVAMFGAAATWSSRHASDAGTLETLLRRWSRVREMDATPEASEAAVPTMPPT
jgi:uncharacterized membrane protein YeiB